jgi:hypothetical protein
MSLIGNINLHTFGMILHSSICTPALLKSLWEGHLGGHLGGHFGNIFCIAPADRRYTLKLFSHEQLHMVDFHLRVYRISDPEKRQKEEKRLQKIVIFGEMGQKRPKK